MKRFLLTALCALFVCCLAIGATSCNTSHTHAYTEQVVSDKYLATPATSTKRATYYYSCVCGAKGTETFEAGETHEIEIKLYVDGEYFASAFTDSSQGYRLVSPQKPEDITTNPNSKVYFDCWYADKDCTTMLDDDYKFTDDSNVYGKLVTIHDFSFKYRVEDGNAYITGLNGKYDDALLVIPSTIDEYPIEKIDEKAFENCTFKTVFISDGIKGISEKAFYNCSNLINIVIPNSVETIGEGALNGCSGLIKITLPFVGGSRKTTTPFGHIFGTDSYDGGIVTEQYSSSSSVISITYHFYIPISLKSVTITDGEIFEGAFANCEFLTNITIPDSATSIGFAAFSHCTNLISITIPNSVTRIEYGAFYNSGVTEIHYNGDLTDWLNIENLGYLMGFGHEKSPKLLFIAGKRIEGELVIPEGVTSICDDAFTNCVEITNVRIPNSVTVIGYAAFNNSNLTRAVISEGVETIGTYAFRGCERLTSITIPNSVKSIEEGAFFGCTSLTNVTISEGVETIGTDAFYGCESLKNVTIPSSITDIGYGTFFGCTSLVSVKISEGVETIRDSAFSDCESLTSVTIPSSVKLIDSYAFSGCTSLASVKISEGVARIGNSAFNRCESLTSIVIPKSITSIGNEAFSYCSKLTTIEFNGTINQWNSIAKSSGWNENTGNLVIKCTDGTI